MSETIGSTATGKGNAACRPWRVENGTEPTFAYSLLTRNPVVLEVLQAPGRAAITETALERAGWPWRPGVSLCPDVLWMIEDRTA